MNVVLFCGGAEMRRDRLGEQSTFDFGRTAWVSSDCARGY